MAIVLPVTSSSVKNTAAPMLRISNCMLPACFAHEAANAFSVSVFVSQGELEKVSSICRATFTESSEFATFTVYQPTRPFQ